MMTLVDLIFQLLAGLLASHGQQLPAEVVTASQAAVDAWEAAKSDPVTKANLEAQRG
jgi:hypothetical protein